MAEEEKEPISNAEILDCNNQYQALTGTMIEKYGFNAPTFSAMVMVGNLYLSMRDNTPEKMRGSLKEDKEMLLKLMGETFDQLASQKV